MGASGAHHRGTGRNRIGKFRPLLRFFAEGLCHHVLGELVNSRQDIAAGDLQPHGPHLLFDDVIQFLHHHKFLHLGGKVLDELFRQGICHAQFQDAGAVAENLLDVLVGGGGGDDAEFCAAHLHAVEGGRLRVLPQLFRALLHDGVALFRIPGHHDVFRDVLFVGLLVLDALSRFHHRLGMGDTGAHFHEYRGIELLRQLVGHLREGQGLRGIRRLQHGNLCRDGMMAAVLLVLGGVHSRIICHNDHHAGIHPRIGHGEQRVCRHVEPNMLLGAKRAPSRQGCAKGGFHCHLLIGCPFAVDLVILDGFLGDLGTGRTGIARNKADPGLIEPSGYRLVSQHQFFHAHLPLSLYLYIKNEIHGSP